MVAVVVVVVVVVVVMVYFRSARAVLGSTNDGISKLRYIRNNLLLLLLTLPYLTLLFSCSSCSPRRNPIAIPPCPVNNTDNRIEAFPKTLGPSFSNASRSVEY